MIISRAFTAKDNFRRHKRGAIVLLPYPASLRRRRACRFFRARDCSGICEAQRSKLERKARPRAAGMRPKTKDQSKDRLQPRMQNALALPAARSEDHFGYANAERMKTRWRVDLGGGGILT
jgi:hypothetical protein